MGCGASKNSLETVDDSVHVMLKHDKKAAQKAGKTVTGYVPRAEHPLLATQNDNIGETQGAESAQAENGNAVAGDSTAAAHSETTQESTSA